MLFSSRDDFRRCTEIVRKELYSKNIVVKDEILKKITEDVMNFSYSKGGDYSSKILRSFAEVYIEHGLYKKYLG
ncbi:MAG: hypothetical protein OSJ72_20990 [Lachnospiraceae bacterium]|nr:hypothetical protein [Lachnospiraceae bacterium]